MTARPCNGCPLRFTPVPGRITQKRCGILQFKLDQVRGLDITMIDFKCPTKTALFQPGQCVRFLGAQPWGEYDEFDGYVVRWAGNRVLVVCEETDKPFCRIRPDRLTRIPDQDRRVCIHCGMPEGISIEMKMPEDEKPRPWICREGEWLFGEAGAEHMPCEYEPACAEGERR